MFLLIYKTLDTQTNIRWYYKLHKGSWIHNCLRIRIPCFISGTICPRIKVVFRASGINLFISGIKMLKSFKVIAASLINIPASFARGVKVAAIIIKMIKRKLEKTQLIYIANIWLREKPYKTLN